LPLAGGSRFTVAGTDLLPEINREPNWRMALWSFGRRYLIDIAEVSWAVDGRKSCPRFPASKIRSSG
jgi:hypothetical protein